MAGGPERRELGTCRDDTCRAKLLWAISATGARIPLDADAPVYHYDPKTGQAVRAPGYYVTHYKTCRNPGRFSKWKR